MRTPALGTSMVEVRATTGPVISNTVTHQAAVDIARSTSRRQLRTSINTQLLLSTLTALRSDRRSLVCTTRQRRQAISQRAKSALTAPQAEIPKQASENSTLPKSRTPSKSTSTISKRLLRNCPMLRRRAIPEATRARVARVVIVIGPDPLMCPARGLVLLAREAKTTPHREQLATQRPTAACTETRLTESAQVATTSPHQATSILTCK